MQEANKFNVADLPTMSSIEMVEYINADREAKAAADGLPFPCKKYRRLQHKSFLAKVPKVLGASSAKYFADDNFATGKGAQATRQIYLFPKREACLMAMSYSYELQAKVFDRMTELEGRVEIGSLDFSSLADLTLREMQDRVAQAEKLSFTERGQKGSGLRQPSSTPASPKW
jgi:hypothetical protein